jgi:hypothetical protein
VTIIDLTSDSEDEFERSTRKRFKHERSESVKLLASGVSLPDSPENSTKTSKDETRRRKGYPHRKFTERHLTKHIDNESKWFEAISKRCDDLTKLLKQQSRYIGSDDSFDFEIGLLIAQISTDSMSKAGRLQIRDQLVNMDGRRRTTSAGLRRNVFSAIHEQTLIKQDIESWHAKEQKVTERIENSR